MADDRTLQIRQEWHQLLLGLKSTVEGLLATQSINVWNTYGGLNKMCVCIEKIMTHRLRVSLTPQGSIFDYWNFVRGLRWINPVVAPPVELIKRQCESLESASEGKVWLKQSLLSHNLSIQIGILVKNRQHLLQHYNDDAFLCQKHYVQAMLICLQAVEQNTAALLAEINPNLLNHLPRKQARLKRKQFHVRSASLPINAVSQNTMIRRHHTTDRLAPRILAPKTESVLCTSPTHATASTGTSPESAKEALLQVLSKSGETIDSDTFEDYTFYDPLEFNKHSDPLMNLQVFSSVDFSLTPREGTIRRNCQSLTDLANRQNKRIRTSSLTGDTPEDCVFTIDSNSKRSSGLLDSILNDEEDEFAENGINIKTPPESTMPLTHTSPSEVSTSSVQEDPMAASPTFVLTDKPRTHSDLSYYSMPNKSFSGSMDSGLSSLPTSCLNLNDAPERTVHTSTLPKKMTHCRSMSDYGLPHKQIHLVEEESLSSADNSSLSSSLPNQMRRQSTTSGQAYFPQPTKGQSLMSFLSSQDFHTCAELDKENAHFSISEALISAIEQMKWNKVLRPQGVSEEESDSDEEIQDLKQRIRIRRRERMKEKEKGFPKYLEDGVEGASNATASSPLSSTSSASESYGSSDEVHDTEIAEEGGMGISPKSNLSSLKESGLSLSLASLYSDADLKRSLEAEKRAIKKENSPLDGSGSYLSAESVAISLLKKFSEKHLPKASELEWLVSEQDAPQELLPLPDSYPISPDDSENMDGSMQRTRIRGNSEWAPPRPQIIFNIHPTPRRKVVLSKQNYRCAGCGAKVEPGYMKRYRYCEYLGKYFCPRCHTNQVQYIPGRIIRKWDFSKYQVSNFANDLLAKIYSDPLFNIHDINVGLYRKVKMLDQIREFKLQLCNLKTFLQTCRDKSLYGKLKELPTHWIEDIHMYSIEELVKIKHGDIYPTLKALVNDSILHVSECQLCHLKGFICELCNNDKDIIFPFELHRVIQCNSCKACYHHTCYVPEKCPKCARIEARRLAQAELEDSSDEEETLSK